MGPIKWHVLPPSDSTGQKLGLLERLALFPGQFVKLKWSTESSRFSPQNQDESLELGLRVRESGWLSCPSQAEKKIAALWLLDSLYLLLCLDFVAEQLASTRNGTVY